MKYFIFLIVVLSLFSTPKVLSQNIEIENFETFLIKFKSDSTFQKSRLISPIVIIYSTDEFVEIGDGFYELDMDTIKVNAEDWKFESLSYTENVSEKIINRVDGLIDFQISGLDNGILVIYTFVTKDRKWYLKMYNDQST